MDVLPASVSVHHIYATDSEARRGHQIRWRLLATVWVLEIEPGCFGRVVSVLNHLSVPKIIFKMGDFIRKSVYESSLLFSYQHFL